MGDGERNFTLFDCNRFVVPDGLSLVNLQEEKMSDFTSGCRLNKPAESTLPHHIVSLKS